MAEFWNRGNCWIHLPEHGTTFRYVSWQRFLSESPYDSVSWKRREICLLSWATKLDQNIRLLQIVFLSSMTNETEWFSWEIPVHDEEAKSIQSWLSERIPSQWKL